jgi:hypothetical protein
VSAVEGLPEIAEVAGVDEVGALVLAAVTPDVEPSEIGAAEQGIIGFRGCGTRVWRDGLSRDANGAHQGVGGLF